MRQTTISSQRIYPRISLEAEWDRQANNLANLFAKELKFKSTQAYINSLPRFKPPLKSWHGRFNTPVIVETRIKPERQTELVGMRYILSGLRKKDWNKKKTDYLNPKSPYTAWLDDGAAKLNQAPQETLKKLKAKEIAATELDGIALYISNPKILDHHFLYLPGTVVESDYVAFMDLWFGLPRLDFNFFDNALPKFGSVMRARQK